jgi:DNA-binding GntR family transcriptional regulator
VEPSEAELVRVLRNRGAFVTILSLHEALEIFDALTMIEQAVAEMAAERFGSVAISELRHLVEKQKKAADVGNDELATQIGRSFHHQLVILSQNKVIEEIHTQLSHRASLLSSLYSRTHNAWVFAKDHETIVNLIEARKAAEVKQLIHSHNTMIARSHEMEECNRGCLSREESLRPYLE